MKFADWFDPPWHGLEVLADPDQRGERDAGDARYDSRVTMVQERLLEALLLETPATTDMTEEAEPTQAQPSPSLTPHEAGSEKDGPAGSATVGAAGEDCGGLAPTPMVVEGEGDEGEGYLPVAGTGADSTPSGNRSAGSNGNGTDPVPTAVQVVASMVDSAFQVRGLPRTPCWDDHNMQQWDVNNDIKSYDRFPVPPRQVVTSTLAALRK